MKKIIASPHAPKAVGPYSQAVETAGALYVSGQLPIDAETGRMAEGIEAQARRVFDNLAAVAEAAGGSFSDVVKITIYLTDLANFGVVNEIMKSCFAEPYPARATVGVRELPRGALVEADLVLVLD